MNSIHARIRARREAARLSLEQVAAQLRISWQAVQQWEKPGGTQPKRIRMKKLAEILDTSVEFLETGTEPRHPAQLERPVTEESPTARNMPRSWPFKRVSMDRVRRLHPEELAYLEGKIAAALDEIESIPPEKRRSNIGS